MNRIVDFLLRLPPHGPHATVDAAMGGVAFGSLVMQASIPTFAAGCVSFIYFCIMIGKEIAKWHQSRKDKAQKPPS